MSKIELTPIEQVKITPALLSNFEGMLANGWDMSYIQIGALIDHIRWLESGGWARITDDASLPEVGRKCDWLYRGVTVVSQIHSGQYTAKNLRDQLLSHYRYATPMPEDG